MNTTQIKRDCKKCPHKCLKQPAGAQMPTDWCKLAGKACSSIQKCETAAKRMKRRPGEENVDEPDEH